jgi:hypothetical protein
MDTFLCLSDSGLYDLEDCAIVERDLIQIREKILEKTFVDSFPATNPLSTDPATGR